VALFRVRGGADKSLAFPISYFPICSTTKIIFLGWVKEVRTMKSYVCGAQVEICRVKIFFFNPVACCFLYKAKDLSAPLLLSSNLSRRIKALNFMQSKYHSYVSKLNHQ
jgi:hypothetical protein